jgi:hypothetical protein
MEDRVLTHFVGRSGGIPYRLILRRQRPGPGYIQPSEQKLFDDLLPKLGLARDPERPDCFTATALEVSIRVIDTILNGR